MHQKAKNQQSSRNNVVQRTDRRIAYLRMTLQSWFGFPMDKSEECGSFKGMTTRDTCTKGVHFFPLKEMLPLRSIVLKTEQEAALPTFLPHILHKEIREDRSVWLAMGFTKKAAKLQKCWED